MGTFLALCLLALIGISGVQFDSVWSIPFYIAAFWIAFYTDNPWKSKS